MSIDFNTEHKRKKLAPRNEPYWHKIQVGWAIGYRKGRNNTGTYLARYQAPSGHDGKRGKTHRSVIGKESVFPEFNDALQAANKWCSRQEMGLSGKSAGYTVRDAINDYCKWLEINRTGKTAKDTQSRLAHHVYDSLGNTEVSKLTTLQLRNWLDSRVHTDTDDDPEQKRKSMDTANRVWSMLRAALNRSFKNGIVEDDSAWRRIERFENVSKSRQLYLTDEQVKRLLKHTTGAFNTICRAAIYTGARYSELANAKVKDFHAREIVLSGKTGTRICYLSDEAAAFFSAQTKDKLPEAWLIPHDNGGQWRHSSQTRPMNDAIRKARLPEDTVFYSLRHYHISRALKAGVNVQVIAENTGTSPDMIARHYGKWLKSDRHEMMNRAQIELGI